MGLAFACRIYSRTFLLIGVSIYSLFVAKFSRADKNETEALAPMVVTARGGFAEPMASSPWSTERMEVNDIRLTARSMPEALSGLPSVMVQKTALGQSSPYVRGFTGYHNLLLVDGIRLNHSAMRSGPNQYWSTVEILGADRIELVRGPNGITYGADAIGGVVNIISENPYFTDEGIPSKGEAFARFSSAESSWTGHVKGEVSTKNWFAELSHAERSFGDLEGGRQVGKQINTGYDVLGTNFRLARRLGEDSSITFGFQRVFMEDVPRTHKTVDGLEWEGLSKGKEIWRRLDQERNLYYGKLAWEGAGGLADAGLLTLSFHQHGQERHRRREKSGTHLIDDKQGFDLDDLGFSSRFETDDPWGGRLAYGFECHLEDVSSFGSDLNNSSGIARDYAQGPLAAEARHHRYAIYVNDTYEVTSGWTFEPGIRFSSVQAELGRYYLKNSDTSTIQNPKTKKYEELIGSLRISKEISDGNFLFGGLSQGFRPPSLYDLTSTDETSAVESPNTSLDSETFLQLEVGLRKTEGDWKFMVSAYHTWINDMIVRSPIESGKSDVLKANGDGFIQGIEIELGYDWTSSWSSELSFSWMDGEVEQLLDDNATGTVSIDGRNYMPVDRATTRLMPIQAEFLTRYAPPASPWWGELSILAVDRADDLSLKDESDDSRIPTNGTPGYILFGLRGGRSIGENSAISLAAENLGDEDYRVHGSGLNGPGRNFIVSLSHSF
jgi:hemoglobin/transferrin/lactoferrin receptor protein